jgi:hypothetical protein
LITGCVWNGDGESGQDHRRDGKNAHELSVGARRAVVNRPHGIGRR